MAQKRTLKAIRVTMIFFFVLTFGSVNAMNKAQLTIEISDCRNSKNYAYLSELKILKDGKKYKTLKPQYESKQILADLDLGTYTLVYKSLFEKEESIVIKITEYKNYATNLCTDFIDYSKETYKHLLTD